MQKLITAVAVLILTGCRSNEIGNSNDVNPEAIYQEYSIAAIEGAREASFTAQFRFGGVNGTTLVLNDNSFVSLNGKRLTVDSTDGMGAYYKETLPMPKQAVMHTWQFTDANNKYYTNKILMHPFTLLTGFKEPLTTAALELSFDGLPNSEEINIAINDTSTLSIYRDIDTTLTVVNGLVILSAAQMRRLAPGPLSIYINQTKRADLTEATREGGAIIYSFELQKREAILKK